MSIVSSEIVEDAMQVDDRRHIREVHTDHVGEDHSFTWMAEETQDVAMVLSARAAWLPGYLEQSEIEANLQEIENG